MRTVALLILVCSLSVGVISGENFWDNKSYKTWKYEEVEKILSDSPWSGTVAYPIQSQGREIRKSSGEIELNNQYIVRLFTALPIRQGYVRMFQLMNKYDELPENDQKVFDQKFGPALSKFGQEIVINLDFSSDDPSIQMEVNRRLKQVNVDQFKQSAFLITDSCGKVEISQYQPPAPDGSGAKFIYPRSIDGQEVITDQDKEVKFELWIPGTGHKVNYVWNIEDLTFDGKIAY